MRFSLPDGQTVMVDQPFTMADIQYPANWLRLLTPSERLEFGAVELPEPPTFDGRYYSAPGVPHPIEVLRDVRKREAAARRWEAETTGVVPPGVRTDERSRTAILAARTLAKEDPAFTVEWKHDGKFIVLTALQVVSAANAVADYVRACFSAERAHGIAIDALSTAQAVIDYDLSTGWPDAD